LIETTWACLDFTKTVGWEAGDRRDDALVDYEALVAWAERAGVLPWADATQAREQAAAQPLQAGRVLEAAIELRRAVYGIFSALGSGREPAAGELATLNAHVSEAMAHLEVRASGVGRFDWEWRALEPGEALTRVLWPVARSAAELLTSDEVRRVKLCEGDDCGWLFVDASRNRSRRWCDMSGCGNLAKVRRFRARHRGEA